ncbi:hypothetical protein [Paracoccus siganidrum]|uniref:Uncharacterized protein n=1 Tax=Paracoccus siganidrum TaxID=1276757 RepID=A0A419A8P8_9RHOB|nr:hypothetical protein [Paracoccus siganidrum]RJL18233.1 hypothetical protein D3P05_07785 [Paracoccus siganidrum]RMC33410.1 hypothetical protein C9E82_13245 [Paracoccus siganidrum]
MERPLTAREAKIVRSSPQLGWPHDTMAEAQRHLVDPSLPYAGWTDPCAPDPDQSACEGRVALLAAAAAVLGAVAGAALAVWVLA